ncbi:hypothetical protein C3E79_05625 [Corynebacterium liangguodongii]|uniref:Uncharacterized protein n=1 Tax=Corynebacterium liangguodongii TaxID=2079535 RepID=A0A2S0WHB5_9CORY|nr:hypothetical protein C3E79_05625 [Corynebacterium liangguodongii]PWC00308.1 hypothetical protein DF219_02265 [Corynebacterium liangguodongii]
MGLAACQSGAGSVPQAEPEPGPKAESMGNASPAASPPSTAPDGTVYPFAAVDDLETSGRVIAVRSGDDLRVGGLDDVAAGGGAAYRLDPTCGDITSTRAGQFVTACGETVRVFDEVGEQAVELASPATSAAMTSTGEILTGADSERTVRVYRDGEEVDSFGVARETDQILAVPRAGGPDVADSAVRINRFDTTIQDLDWRGGRQGGTLRAGLGVGGVAAGRDGLVLAADNTGSQLLVYTANDIIRLQQSAPVPPSPWAVSWDDESALAWVASTASNVATGYDISTGVPVKKAQVNTIADALHMVTLDDGTLVIASATGGGIQVVPPALKLQEKGQAS